MIYTMLGGITYVSSAMPESKRKAQVDYYENG